ncbi:N-(5'-phosphoribosyl)anthranilate isomerase [Petrotoga mexicana DSM 14811]|uniref:N-(5'-phosphoribosyl)anthranilate isomerase n=1 Tax=Petrotoga mexicana DSM 14811 TaxID=1122954 RepID=A0A2K1PFF6_9BACT|nr:phosphoribosylanthranilate isomerase [Petrotoga mexicana]PNS01505.1 N-(5'-phosphoribosyl)anthranilate isomerase [Petrotoga mexicana DSM 14811]
MIRIKVCGITNIEDAINISKAGVDALGFILAESPRKVELSKILEISKELPPFVSRVAVVVNPNKEEIEKIERSKVFDYVQFHGSEDANIIKNCKLKTIKAIKIENKSSLEEISKYNDFVDYFLFDTKIGEKIGGTGHTFNWEILKEANIKKPFILAGGLSPENVVEAIKTIKPNAVDLNSKVELYPGKKDIRSIKETIEKVKNLEING